MLFDKKLKRIIDVDKIEKKHKNIEPEPLEKGDLPAMIIAAFTVFGPVLIALIALVYGLAWLFVH